MPLIACNFRLSLMPLLLALLAWPVSARNLAEGQEFNAFLQEMEQRHGFDRNQLLQWFDQVESDTTILERMRKPAERVLNWAAYQKLFIQAERIQSGRAFRQKHSAALARAETRFGVPVAIILGILGVETRYGRWMGKDQVLQAVATLAFDYPPRSAFFRSELEQFLLLSREEGWDPREIMGSYAGAMGYGQFISSSYRNYAIDFDGDEKRNIIDNPVDAIGSIANYLSRHGWIPGLPVARRIEMAVPDEWNPAAPVSKPGRSIDDLPPALKAMAQDWLKDPKQRELARFRLLRLEGSDGTEWWLTTQNFYAITRYNHSDLYAMAVYHLGEALNREETE